MTIPKIGFGYNRSITFSSKVAIDYFSKWIEIEPFARIQENYVYKFIWLNIICRFSLPHEFVIDNGRQYTGQVVVSFYEEMG